MIFWSKLYHKCESNGLLLAGEGELTLGRSTVGTIIDVGGQVGGSEGGSCVKSTSLTAIWKSVELSKLGISSEDSYTEPCNGVSGGSGGGLEGGKSSVTVLREV